MKILWISLIATLTALSVYAEESPEVMSKDKINLSEEVKKPTAIVDEFGNISYKYPKNFNTGSEKEAAKPTTPAAPEKPKFIKAANTGHRVNLDFSTFGSLPGVSAGYDYLSGNLIYGGSLKYYSYKITSTDEIFDFFAGTVKFGYSFYPRWYGLSPSKTIISPSVYLLGGYVSGSSNQGSSLSGPLVGVGASVSYPFTQSWGVSAGIETLHVFSSGQNGSLGGSGFIGVNFNW